MTIKETVRTALTHVPGNQPLSSHMQILHDEGKATCCMLDGSVIVALSPSQIVRALRDLSQVKRDRAGRYIVKGRRVPPCK